MDLQKIIKEVENRGIEVVFLKDYEEKGRLLEVQSRYFLFLKKGLSDIETTNIILHELSHFENKDNHSILSQIPTYAHRIEHQAEIDRITNFLSLINEEYPIDENFNYLDYMKNAFIPTKYETVVKETATKLYQENLENNRI